VLGVYRVPGDERPGCFVELTFNVGRITSNRDFRYVPYSPAIGISGGFGERGS
jgi:hypothetical protein